MPLLLVLAAILLAGCATPPAVESSPSGAAVTVPVASSTGWWRARFRLRQPGDGGPRWALDLLLAHRVCAPALEAQAERITFWRFHRRAGNDATGHQFSCLFYSDADTARTVFREIRQNALSRRLQQHGLVAALSTSDISRPSPEPGPADASDPDWLIPLQETWPAYIQGVSAVWLALIERYARDHPAPADDPEALLAAYREIEELVNLTWRLNGKHAFLHHLNAVFGYQPLYMNY
ncbi:MAG: hypothetical protein R3202_10480 [Candidatus Competibacterales bacterium]|nr:hypothetical protein [Candidatus Competibacterales bacterium]